MTTRKERDAVVQMVAEYVAEWDRYVNHPWLLSDVILSKFNVRRRRPRRNPWYRSIGIAQPTGLRGMAL